MEEKTTPFSDIYHLFSSKVTDDMYMEMTKEETERELQAFLLAAITFFEFPRVNLNDYSEITITNEETGEVTKDFQFNCLLTIEEQNILAVYMLVAWFTQQIATVDNTRLKYSGTDFKFTSQANHIAKLESQKEKYTQEGFHLQRLYKRRKADENGIYRSTFGSIMETSVRGS